MAARQICTARLADKYALLPSDMDGTTAPPANSPNYVMSNDWAFIFGPYSLQLQKFHVDFATPANSTFTDGIGGGFNSFIQIPLNTVVGTCGDNGGKCVPQPATARVLNRWMSSGAMDKNGNIAFGYSVSSATVFPSIRIAGRGRADIRNTLRGELEVVTGAGSQTSTGERWGGL